MPAVPTGGEEPASPTPSHQRTLHESVVKGLVLSRAIIFIPVVVLMFAAAGAFVYGTVVAVEAAREIVAHAFPVGNKIGLFLVVIDLFLIGATMLISAIGFYELFLGYPEESDGSHLPPWLVIEDLNDLKWRVVAMIVLVVAVAFAEVVVDPGSADRMLQMGAGVALFIAALTAFLRLTDSRRARSPREAESAGSRQGDTA